MHARRLSRIASQAAFVVIPEIPRSDISMHKKNKRGAAAQLMESIDRRDSPFIAAKAPRKMDVT